MPRKKIETAIEQDVSVVEAAPMADQTTPVTEKPKRVRKKAADAVAEVENAPQAAVATDEGAAPVKKARAKKAANPVETEAVVTAPVETASGSDSWDDVAPVVIVAHADFEGTADSNHVENIASTKPKKAKKSEALDVPVDAFDAKPDEAAAPKKAKLDLAQSAQVTADHSENGFARLGLCHEILTALEKCGYTNPTDVQKEAIPAFLQGRDLLVSSRTGSGKTAAFMLPAIQKISQMPAKEAAIRTENTENKFARNDRNDRDRRRGGWQDRNRREPMPVMKGPAKPSLLVLTPTRELAIQVAEATESYGRNLRRIECTSILGGMPYPKQLSALARQPDILVATPGRLLDHIRAGRIDLSDLSMMVFDEADLMLDMGFSEDINALLEATSDKCQTLMFSATIDPRVERLASHILKNPVRIELKTSIEAKANIAQQVYWTDDINHKEQILCRLLEDETLNQAIVFVATKADTEKVAELLMDQGFSARAIHGDMSQAARNRTLMSVRKAHVQVLVATDVAARGIDIPDITHVVNFDIPRQAEDYVHRIGRTGRAGRSGLAMTLISHKQKSAWDRIVHTTKNEVNVCTVPGLEPKLVFRSSTAKRPVGMRPGSGKPQRYGSGGGYSRDSGGYGRGAGAGNRWGDSRSDSRGYGSSAGSRDSSFGASANRSSGFAGSAGGGFNNRSKPATNAKPSWAGRDYDKSW